MTAATLAAIIVPTIAIDPPIIDHFLIFGRAFHFLYIFLKGSATLCKYINVYSLGSKNIVPPARSSLAIGDSF